MSGVFTLRHQLAWCGPDALLAWVPPNPGSEAPRGDGSVEWVIDRRITRLAATPVPLADALPLLASLPADVDATDAIRAWSAATKLAIDLCTRQRVAPRVIDGEARWAVLLTHGSDRSRFEVICRAMPPAAHGQPASRTPPRVWSAQTAVRAFLDAAADHLYRGGAWPGGGRGWPRKLAESLSGGSARFTPDDSRDHGVAARLEARALALDAPRVRLSLELALPSARARFPLRLLASGRRPGQTRPAADAWGQQQITIGDLVFPAPTVGLLHDLARARRAFPPLDRALQGARPADLTLSVDEVWQLLDTSRAALEASGIELILPTELAAQGTRRLRARMRLMLEGPLDLSRPLSFRWEVTLGDRVLDGVEFAELRRTRQPLVHHRGEWIVLDPHEIAKLPAGLDQMGTLSGADALRAVLLGEHEGIPVVADRRLELLLDALRQPPDEPPPAGLVATLRPYQQRGFNWLHTLGAIGLGVCLADDMGLGKTLQAIAHLLRRAGGGRRHLVVCPTSLLGNWTRELRRFAPTLRLHRHHGQLRGQLPTDVDVVLTTYGVLVHDPDPILDVGWDVAVLDEAQAIKNPDSQRARLARRLRAAHRVALSGTPVENRLEELWSLMEFLLPGFLGPRATFLREVAVPVERLGDRAAAERLRNAIAPFMLRRTKGDPGIADDLPEKIERVESCLLTAEQRKLYEEVCEEHMSSIVGVEGFDRRGRVLAMLTALKQVCNHPSQFLKDEGPWVGRSGKLDRLLALLERIDGEPALIFTQYTAMGDLLTRVLAEERDMQLPFLHGGTPATGRDRLVAEFQRPDGPPLLLVSLKAGGTGLNLTRARHVVHYDRWWNPAVEDQATDRAHRIGQRNRVLVHKLVTEDTLEERIDRLLDAKRDLASSVLATGEGWLAELDDDALKRLVMLGSAS